MVFSPVNPWTFPVNPNFPWIPDAQVITSISNGNPAIITTLQPHGYSTGFNVRVVFPVGTGTLFGMFQINEQVGTIEVISPNAFFISINTLQYDPFVIGTTSQKPQVIPISQYVNGELLDFIQVNPVNPNTLENVVLFQSSGLQAPGPCSTSQT